MKYRIIIETEVSGKKWYYVQKRFLTFFWIYLSEVMDMSMSLYRISFPTLEEAQKYLHYSENNDYKNSQRKIIKREIFKN